MPATLIEAELFGRERGAYTGAMTRQLGRFELADGATLFLDEVGELPLELQPKLLRVLQEGEYERLGSSSTRHTDVRIIAATNRDLDREVAEGRFREDLFYRLNIFPIRIPPLRERPEDISPLVWSFIADLSEKMGRQIKRISENDMRRFQQYPWPGNVRELRNVIERAMILSREGTLKVDLSHGETSAESSSSEQDNGLLTLDEVQRRHIVKVLGQTNGRVRGPAGAAEILGLKPSTLESRMKKLGVKKT
jgi:transcriptional regulator with GAF, ATPase, and Fis domain